jgi:hypothetical protein
MNWNYLENKANRLDKQFLNNQTIIRLQKDFGTGWFGYVRQTWNGNILGLGSIKLLNQKDYNNYYKEE